jgi:hypothetical protein
MKTRSVQQADHAAHMAEMRNIYKILVGKFEGTRLF